MILFMYFEKVESRTRNEKPNFDVSKILYYNFGNVS